MGTDKGMYEFRGRPLFQWVMESISKVVDEIVISVSNKEQVYGMDLHNHEVIIIPDERPGLGPMGGLVSGFKKCSGDYVAVAPVDAPLIQTSLFDLLFERSKGHDAAVPKIRGYWEPLIAVYRRDAMLSAINTALKQGKLDIRSTFPHMDVVEVDQGEIEFFDPTLLSFININTLEDLEKMNSILALDNRRLI
jgi:molybdopterin-guanine dinucleotide biosynthesis protein A